MKSRFAIVLLATLAGLVSPAVIFGHHGVSDYDVATVVSWRVTVTDFQFANPHSLLDFTRKTDDGKTEEWQGELQSPSMLARKGHWAKDTVKPGDQITVFGCPARNGSKTMLVRKVVVSDGTEYPGG
jgi:hypothetical protein